MAGLFCFRDTMGTFGLVTIILFVCLGSFAGFLAGLLGIGGGIILVPLFLWAFTVSGFAPEVVVHMAFGSSLAVIVPTAFSSTLGHRKRGNVDWFQVGYLVLGGFFGALCGAWLASLLSGVWLQGLFGVMQIVVALKMVIFQPRVPDECKRPETVWPLMPCLTCCTAGDMTFSPPSRSATSTFWWSCWWLPSRSAWRGSVSVLRRVRPMIN
ncbi:MAG: sulfite exporter TauE/SafE family protein [Desulfuromonadales bacterium]